MVMVSVKCNSLANAPTIALSSIRLSPGGMFYPMPWWNKLGDGLILNEYPDSSWDLRLALEKHLWKNTIIFDIKLVLSLRLLEQK